MKRLVITLLIALCLISCKGIEEFVFKERELAKWESLNLSLLTINKSGFPYSEDLSFFLSNEAISESISTLKGTNLKYRKHGYFENWKINIADVELISEDGFMSALIRLEAFNSKGKKKASLELLSQVTVSKIAKNDKGDSDMVELKLIPLHLKPKAFFLGLKIGLSKKRSQQLADLITYINNEPISTSILIGNSTDQSFELVENNKTERVYSDKEENWYYDLKYNTQEKVFKKYISLNSPLFSSKGILLSARYTDKPESSAIMPPIKPDVTASELKNLNKKLSNNLKNLVANLDVSFEYSFIYINKKIFQDYIGLIGSKQHSQVDNKITSVNINSTKVNGYLAQKYSSNEILGLVGLYVHLTKDDAITGQIRINDLNQQWVVDEGIAANLNVSANISASIRAFIGPRVMGGVDMAGITVKLDGSTDKTVNTKFKFSYENINNRNFLLLKPDISCAAIDLKVETDGKWAWKSGWTKVPKIGITFQQLIGNDFIEPVAILSDYRSVSQADFDNTSEDFEIELDYDYLVYTIKPKDLDVSKEGLFISFNPSILKTNDISLIDTIEKEQTDYSKLIANYYSGNKKSCPDSDRVKVHLGDLEFGPNNEIIKFITNGWNDIVNGPGDNNDIVKMLDKLGGIINETTIIDDVSVDAMKEITRFAEKTMGKNNETTKVLNSVSKEMEKIKNNPGKALGETPSNVINEGKKAVKKVIDFVKKPRIKISF
ncbi:hypothetical protein [Winogradskyella luteola]|uniref:Uncharacterized protein n=1 Tax=Winogradskyella luteola TaxID=2828330 RepID=A0A9X1FAN0_9FLAO|nr:hypothetical protein [Winogradskyella luteola]MBV7270662.1 hypothetical protein [Winogradskyella luteola]